MAGAKNKGYKGTIDVHEKPEGVGVAQKKRRGRRLIGQGRGLTVSVTGRLAAAWAPENMSACQETGSASTSATTIISISTANPKKGIV